LFFFSATEFNLYIYDVKAGFLLYVIYLFMANTMIFLRWAIYLRGALCSNIGRGFELAQNIQYCVS